jgi:hypothetical protein
MLTIRMLAIAAVVTAAALLPGRGAAAEPSLSDIATCNEQAAARTGGAALPRLEEPQKAGATAPIIEGDRDLPRKGAGGEKTDPSGSIVTDSADPLVKGMDAQKANDPAYRSAYRECMQQRAPAAR